MCYCTLGLSETKNPSARSLRSQDSRTQELNAVKAARQPGIQTTFQGGISRTRPDQGYVPVAFACVGPCGTVEVNSGTVT